MSEGFDLSRWATTRGMSDDELRLFDDGCRDLDAILAEANAQPAPDQAPGGDDGDE